MGCQPQGAAPGHPRRRSTETAGHPRHGLADGWRVWYPTVTRFPWQRVPKLPVFGYRLSKNAGNYGHYGLGIWHSKFSKTIIVQIGPWKGMWEKTTE